MKIKHILVSQPQPADISKTPYADMMKKYGVTFTFEKFIRLDGISASALRQEHIKLPEYTAIILTSRPFLPRGQGNALQRARNAQVFLHQ